MTASTTTTRNNAASSVRNDVIRDLWITVKQMPDMYRYNFSCDTVMKYMMERVLNREWEQLNANSDYTFGRVRLCEWEAFNDKLLAQGGDIPNDVDGKK